jgi:hypothetical protein
VSDVFEVNNSEKPTEDTHRELGSQATLQFDTATLIAKKWNRI